MTELIVAAAIVLLALAGICVGLWLWVDMLTWEEENRAAGQKEQGSPSGPGKAEAGSNILRKRHG